MHYHFILVNPARGENVGFAARALKTMGFSSLRIVGEPLQDTSAARKTAYGAHDVLDEITTFQSLPEALADLDLTIGTTSKARIKRYDNLAPSQITSILCEKQNIIANMGFVFGSEENGLSTDELDQCDLVSTIPMATGYPSLNLAQSVLIYAWEIYNSDRLNIDEPANHKLQAVLKKEMDQLLLQLEFAQRPLMQQRIMDRVMLLNSDDSELLMAILNKLKRTI